MSSFGLEWDEMSQGLKNIETREQLENIVAALKKLESMIDPTCSDVTAYVKRIKGYVEWCLKRRRRK